MIKTTIYIITTFFAIFACSSNKLNKPNRLVADSNTKSESEENIDPLELICSANLAGKTYVGLGNVKLTAGRITRKDIPEGGDRSRVKPYDALISEFGRIMGSPPQSLLDNPATFLEAPDRWYIEPASNAISIFATYRAAYESALDYVATDPKWQSEPTSESAATECLVFAKKAWDRYPNSNEVKACIEVAMVATANEPDASKRWAYTLASILTSTGFITY